MTEAEFGKAMLEYERNDAKAGRRPKLPCDLTEKKENYEGRLNSYEFNDDQIQIIKMLEKSGAQSSVELGKKLNKKSISISNLTKKLISVNRVKKVGMTDQRCSRRHKTKVWIYDVVEKNV